MSHLTEQKDMIESILNTIVMHLEIFSSLLPGDTLKTKAGLLWDIKSEPTKSGDIWKTIMRAPHEEMDRFIHFNDKTNELYNDDGYIYKELSDADLVRAKQD